MQRLLSRVEGERLLARMIAAQPTPDAMKAELLALTTTQQAALMQMIESHAKRAVIANLLQQTQVTTREDFAYLCARGFAIWHVGKRLHELTDAGRRYAAHLEKLLCQRFQIHLLIETGQDRYHVRFRCPCGWTSSVSKGGYVEANAQRSYRRHIVTAEGMQAFMKAVQPPMMAEG